MLRVSTARITQPGVVKSSRGHRGRVCRVGWSWYKNDLCTTSLLVPKCIKIRWHQTRLRLDWYAHSEHTLLYLLLFFVFFFFFPPPLFFLLGLNPTSNAPPLLLPAPPFFRFTVKPFESSIVTLPFSPN